MKMTYLGYSIQPEKKHFEPNFHVFSKETETEAMKGSTDRIEELKKGRPNEGRLSWRYLSPRVQSDSDVTENLARKGLKGSLCWAVVSVESSCGGMTDRKCVGTTWSEWVKVGYSNSVDKWYRYCMCLYSSMYVATTNENIHRSIDPISSIQFKMIVWLLMLYTKSGMTCFDIGIRSLDPKDVLVALR